MLNMIKFLNLTLNTYRKDGFKFRLLYAFHPTPFGNCLIAITDVDKAVVCLDFVDGTETHALQVLRREWPLSEISEDTENETKSIIESAFRTDPSSPNSICVLLKGTEFQMKVWRCLTSIPKGTSTTYEQVAKMIENDKAVRAVGNAMSKNRIAYIVPCHRVRGKTGGNRYRWGTERKEAILKCERQQDQLND